MSAPGAYPLAWPDGWPRTKLRKKAQFKVGWDQTLKELDEEIARLGGRYPLVSTNCELTIRGRPRRDRYEPADRGVAVYFELDGRQKVFACDTFTTVKDNLRGVCLGIAAIRALDRYGMSAMLERALAGFEALPPPGGWRTVLGFGENAAPDLATVEHKYRELVKVHHPDARGDPEQFRKINAAILQAREELGS